MVLGACVRRACFRDGGFVDCDREGKAQGRQEGALQMLISLVRDGMLSFEDAARKAGMSEAEFKAAMDR